MNAGSPAIEDLGQPNRAAAADKLAGITQRVQGGPHGRTRAAEPQRASSRVRDERRAGASPRLREQPDLPARPDSTRTRYYPASFADGAVARAVPVGAQRLSGRCGLKAHSV
jgi:hypothetical protein